MSETLIASLNQRLADSERERANLRAALKEERGKRKAEAAEAEQLRLDLNAALDERDGFKSKAEATPGEHAKEIADLKATIARRDHKDAFKAAAARHGARPEAVDDLYQLLGLQPGEKPAAAEDFAEPLAAAKGARAWAFGEQAQSDSTTASDPSAPASGKGGAPQEIVLGATKAPSGGGRGGSDLSSGQLRVRSADLGDGAWMQANQEAVAKASAEGRLVVVD